MTSDGNLKPQEELKSTRNDKCLGFFLRLFVCILSSLSFFKRHKIRDFPGGPVVKTRHFHYRGHGFDPWSEN